MAPFVQYKSKVYSSQGKKKNIPPGIAFAKIRPPFHPGKTRIHFRTVGASGNGRHLEKRENKNAKQSLRNARYEELKRQLQVFTAGASQPTLPQTMASQRHFFTTETSFFCVERLSHNLLCFTLSFLPNPWRQHVPQKCSVYEPTSFLRQNAL